MSGTSLATEAGIVVRRLPVGSIGGYASGWYGAWLLVTTEAALFGYLLFGYFYVTTQAAAPWPPDGPPRSRHRSRAPRQTSPAPSFEQPARRSRNRIGTSATDIPSRLSRKRGTSRMAYPACGGA